MFIREIYANAYTQTLGAMAFGQIGQMRITTLLISTIFGTTLSSCSTDITPTDYFDNSKPFTVTIYNRDNSTGLTTTRQKEIQPTTENFNKFIDWCKHNNTDWQSSPVSVIGQIAITQGDFGLVYINEGVAIHFIDKEGKPRQYTKRIKKGDFDFLLGE